MRILKWLLAIIFVLLLVSGYFIYRGRAAGMAKTARLLAWLNDPSAHPDWAIKAGQRCGQAPFIFPTDGYIGFVWGDSFRPGHRHQGLDIFGGGEVNVTPVIAAYPGYLTRLPEWISTVIVRIPNDPLLPGRQPRAEHAGQIWTYYTHMADAQGNSFISERFPPGTSEVFVEAGTLLGYQGNYSGDPHNPVGVHLHFSIVLDDGRGHFRNELEIGNTLDPSPYFGMNLNANASRGEQPMCLQPQEEGS